MARLFAEHFLTHAVKPEFEVPTPSYNEARELNLDPNGRVFVELASIGDTHTLTEVRAESEDHDPEDDFVAQLDTTTKATGEAADFVSSETALGTHTRQGAEEEDRGPENLLGTRTDAIQGEAEDFVTAEHLLGTETRAPESPDVPEHPYWPGTKTTVSPEAEDFELDELSSPGQTPRY